MRRGLLTKTRYLAIVGAAIATIAILALASASGTGTGTGSYVGSHEVVPVVINGVPSKIVKDKSSVGSSTLFVAMSASNGIPDEGSYSESEDPAPGTGSGGGGGLSASAIGYKSAMKPMTGTGAGNGQSESGPYRGMHEDATPDNGRQKPHHAMHDEDRKSNHHTGSGHEGHECHHTTPTPLDYSPDPNDTASLCVGSAAQALCGTAGSNNTCDGSDGGYGFCIFTVTTATVSGVTYSIADTAAVAGCALCMANCFGGDSQSICTN